MFCFSLGVSRFGDKDELVKYTIIMRPHFDLLDDRFSEHLNEEFKAKPEVMNHLKGTANVKSS